MKTLINKLLREYLDDFDDFDMDFEEPREFDLNSLPDVLTLYRILELDSEQDINNINKEEVGSHYSMDRNNLIKSRNKKSDKIYILLTVKAPKKLIDAKETIELNNLYPMEKEINLKNKGRGAKIVNIERI